VHVRRLRAKLGPGHEQLIGTVRNVGYKFVRPGRAGLAVAGNTIGNSEHDETPTLTDTPRLTPADRPFSAAV
jgi:DNA-binding winged helix-turn-helix (wHTH) protein